MINKVFSKLTVLISVALLTGCAAALGSTVGSVLLNEITKEMVSNVLNEQTETSPVQQNSQLQSTDIQVQSSEIQQAQSINSQASNTSEPSLTSQNTVNTQVQQQCKNLTESITLPDGQTVHETRVACLDEKTGNWHLIQ